LIAPQVELTLMQKKYYRALYEKNLAVLMVWFTFVISRLPFPCRSLPLHVHARLLPMRILCAWRVGMSKFGPSVESGYSNMLTCRGCHLTDSDDTFLTAKAQAPVHEAPPVIEQRPHAAAQVLQPPVPAAWSAR